MVFTRPSDCASFASSSGEGNSSWWADTTTKSPISKHDTNSTVGTPYGSFAPDTIARYRKEGGKSVFESTRVVPLVEDGGVLLVGTSLDDRSILNIPHVPHLEIKGRCSKSELKELAVAHAQAITMYQDQCLKETQKITCELCLIDGSEFVLKNLHELTLHIRIHNIPEYAPCDHIRDEVRRALVKCCCCDDGTTMDN